MRPDILIVLLDDLGFSDLGCYGSEIETPTIDALAERGLRYVNFHSTPLCSPTRASLLTGRNHHAVGMGFLADVDMGIAHSRGRISKDAATLPELLHPLGYRSYVVGKWHLCPLSESSQAGPFDNWPLGRGFDRFYGFLGGLTDQYFPELVVDNSYVDPPARQAYHLSEDLVEHAMQYLRDHLSVSPNIPYFLYMAPGAVHAPHQAPDEFVEKYVKIFEKGWDQTRADRLVRQVQLGIVPAGTRLTERNPGVPPWSELSEVERRHSVYLQASYAGYLEHFDQQLGRLIRQLDRLGRLDNTVILVASDNGAAADGGPRGSVNINRPYNGAETNVDAEVEELAHGSRSWASVYPMGWAMAGNTPFRRYKAFVDAGGVNVPLVVHWPTEVPAHGQVRHQFGHMIDIAPTILDIVSEGREGHRKQSAGTVDGASLRQTLTNADEASPRNVQYYEILGHRAVLQGRWRAVARHRPGRSYDDDHWELYDLDSDFSESSDRSMDFPQKVQELQDLWMQEAQRNGVLPLDDRPFFKRFYVTDEQSSRSRQVRAYQPSNTVIPQYVAPRLFGRDFTIRATGRVSQSVPEGVVVSHGDRRGGYAIFVIAGRPWFEYNYLGDAERCSVDTVMQPGAFSIEARLTYLGQGAGRLVFTVNETHAVELRLTRQLTSVSTQGLRIGHGGIPPVSELYADRGRFPFSADVDVVVFDLGALVEDPSSQRPDLLPPQ